MWLHIPAYISKYDLQLSGNNGTRTQNRFVRKRTLNHLFGYVHAESVKLPRI